MSSAWGAAGPLKSRLRSSISSPWSASPCPPFSRPGPDATSCLKPSLIPLQEELSFLSPHYLTPLPPASQIVTYFVCLFHEAADNLSTMSPAPSPCSMSPGAWDRASSVKMSLSHWRDPQYLSPYQGRYFLVRDVAEKTDVLGTQQSCGAPNFRQVRGGAPVFGMGQPSLLGFRRVLQKLQKDGHRVSMTTVQAGAKPPKSGQRGFWEGLLQSLWRDRAIWWGG